MIKKDRIKILVIIALMIIIGASVGLLSLFCFENITINCHLTTWIGVWVSIANAIFLFATLSSQNRGINNQKESFAQERFETTFFNLLESHRKLTEELSVSAMVLNENLQIERIKLDGRTFFSFAINEISHIQDSLKSKCYSGKFDEQLDFESINAIEQQYASIEAEGVQIKEREKKLLENYNHHRIKFSNLIYDISADKWGRIGNSDDKIMLSVDIFYKTMYPQYNHYIRSLANLLDFAKRREGTYLYFVSSQMSEYELSYIRYHALIDSRFKELNNTLTSN